MNLMEEIERLKKLHPALLFVDSFLETHPKAELFLVFGIFGLLSSDPWGPEGLAIIALYLAPIFYIGIGALVGYFIGRHKNQKKVRSK